MSFPGGDILHGGDPLLSGTRYIIAVFLFLAEGMDKGEDKDEDVDKNKNLSRYDDEQQSVRGGIENLPSAGLNHDDDIVDDIGTTLDPFISSFLSTIREDTTFLLSSSTQSKSVSQTVLPLTTTSTVTATVTKESVYNPSSGSGSSFGFGFSFTE